MTIHELANAVNARMIDLPFDLPGIWEPFPVNASDILLARGGKLVIGINREKGLFAAQREAFVAFGSVLQELSPEEIAELWK